jgi:flagellar protein FliJ
MTQFNFRFQKILDLKENEKEFAQIQMADAIKLQEDGYKKNEAIYHKLHEAEQLKKTKQKRGINISELRMLEDYIHQLQELSAITNRELNHLEVNVNRTQAQLQHKAQEEKTWGNLKQQELTLHKEKSKVEEQNFFDELASTRFYRLAQAGASERG